jgi:hypothetical protein
VCSIGPGTTIPHHISLWSNGRVDRDGCIATELVGEKYYRCLSERRGEERFKREKSDGAEKEGVENGVGGRE